LYARFINWLSATPLGTWLVRHVASPLDPLIFRISNGRFTSTGKPTLPMLALTVVGRKSGVPRTVQLAYHADGDDFLVVASAMGQEKHPGWRYNLEAHPDVEVRVRGASFPARAEALDRDEKARYWPAIKRTIPQMATYERRTDRDIHVFRLRRTERSARRARRGTM
jgi:deazaflavin-dependent oxidoreductase (nitroreductase family)